mmetsp:Transcript_17901/g.26804  ORF Transcript_17901/g.26804 Transcript_17901/m.26804 type:complete len:1037 (+) Transcript_17901:61-3171(+)
MEEGNLQSAGDPVGPAPAMVQVKQEYVPMMYEEKNILLAAGPTNNADSESTEDGNVGRAITPEGPSRVALGYLDGAAGVHQRTPGTAFVRLIDVALDSRSSLIDVGYMSESGCLFIQDNGLGMEAEYVTRISRIGSPQGDIIQAAAMRLGRDAFILTMYRPTGDMYLLALSRTLHEEMKWNKMSQPLVKLVKGSNGEWTTARESDEEVLQIILKVSPFASNEGLDAEIATLVTQGGGTRILISKLDADLIPTADDINFAVPSRERAWTHELSLHGYLSVIYSRCSLFTTPRHRMRWRDVKMSPTSVVERPHSPVGPPVGPTPVGPNPVGPTPSNEEKSMNRPDVESNGPGLSKRPKDTPASSSPEKSSSSFQVGGGGAAKVMILRVMGRSFKPIIWDEYINDPQKLTYKARSHGLTEFKMICGFVQKLSDDPGSSDNCRPSQFNKACGVIIACEGKVVEVFTKTKSQRISLGQKESPVIRRERMGSGACLVLELPSVPGLSISESGSGFSKNGIITQWLLDRLDGRLKKHCSKLVGQYLRICCSAGDCAHSNAGQAGVWLWNENPVKLTSRPEKPWLCPICAGTATAPDSCTAKCPCLLGPTAAAAAAAAAEPSYRPPMPRGRRKVRGRGRGILGGRGSGRLRKEKSETYIFDSSSAQMQQSQIPFVQPKTMDTQYAIETSERAAAMTRRLQHDQNAETSALWGAIGSLERRYQLLLQWCRRVHEALPESALQSVGGPIPAELEPLSFPQGDARKSLHGDTKSGQSSRMASSSLHDVSRDQQNVSNSGTQIRRERLERPLPASDERDGVDHRDRLAHLDRKVDNENHMERLNSGDRVERLHSPEPDKKEMSPHNKEVNSIQQRYPKEYLLGPGRAIAAALQERKSESMIPQEISAPAASPNSSSLQLQQAQHEGMRVERPEAYNMVALTPNQVSMMEGGGSRESWARAHLQGNLDVSAQREQEAARSLTIEEHSAMFRGTKRRHDAMESSGIVDAGAWTMHTDNLGRRYYKNHKQRTTSWNLPQGARLVAEGDVGY